MFKLEAPNQAEVERLLSPTLQEILHKGKNIRRFTGDDLPSNIVIDNVYDHTIRCYGLAHTLPISTHNKHELCKIMLIHDLPEIESLSRLGLEADLTSPEKLANPEKAKQVQELEGEVANQIFDNEELRLYNDFETAANYIKYIQHGGFLPPIGALAKIIDMVDANLMLHQSLCRWAKTADYNPERLDPRLSLPYAFNMSPIFAVQFNLVEDYEIRRAGLDLVASHIRYISDLWQEIFDLRIELPEGLEDF